jgi:hypothetical protein
MSPVGNLHTARLVASALSTPAAAGRAADYLTAPFLPGDGRNLLLRGARQSGSRQQHRIAAEVEEPAQRSGLSGRSHRSSRRALFGIERWEIGSRAVHALSLDVSADGTSHLRIQLIDTQSNGVIGDYNLTKKNVGTSRAGTAHTLRAGVKEIANGWYRLWLGATLPGGNTNILLGINDTNGNPNFVPQGESCQVRAIQLERGQSPSSYRATTRAAGGP